MFHPTGGGRDDRDDEEDRRNRTHQHADEEPEEKPDEQSQGSGSRSAQVDQLAARLQRRPDLTSAMSGPRPKINRDRVRERRAAEQARRPSASLSDTGDAAARSRRAAKFAVPTTSTPQVVQRSQPSQDDLFETFCAVRGTFRFKHDENCRKHLRDDRGSDVLRDRFGTTAEVFATRFIDDAQLEHMHLHNRVLFDGQPGSQGVDTGQPQFTLYLDRMFDLPALRGWKIVGDVNTNGLALFHVGPGG